MEWITKGKLVSVIISSFEEIRSTCLATDWNSLSYLNHPLPHISAVGSLLGAGPHSRR